MNSPSSSLSSPMRMICAAAAGDSEVATESVVLDEMPRSRVTGPAGDAMAEDIAAGEWSDDASADESIDMSVDAACRRDALSRRLLSCPFASAAACLSSFLPS